MRRLIALTVLGGLLAAAVWVLYEKGRAGLDLERERLARESREQRLQALEAVRQGVSGELDGLVQREAARPWYHYRHLYLPPDLVANQLALVPSPIGAEPPEPLVRLHFEYRGGRIVSPAFQGGGLPPPEGGEPPSEFGAAIAPEVRSLAVFAPRLETELGAQATAARPREEVVDLYVCGVNADPGQNLAELARANRDPGARQKLEGDWEAYQGRQGKRAGTYAPPEEAPPRTGVPVDVYPFRFLGRGADDDGWPERLVAVRRVEVDDGEAWLQGFELDVARLRREVVPRVLAGVEVEQAAGGGSPAPARSQQAQAGPPTRCVAAAALGPEDEALALAPPLASVAVAWAGPIREPDLSRGRGLLDGALALVFGVVLVGGLILFQAAWAQRRLAQQRSDFVAALTHELKAPLTGMRALAELLHDGLVSDEDKRREYYASMLGESERLGRLVQNVLDAAKIERGRPLQLHPAPIEPGPLLRDLAERFRPRLETEGFAVEVDVADDLPRALADRESLTQVAANLLDNAAKYGRGEERWIRLEAEAGAGALRIRVRDRGPGVAPGERRRVFERFFRSERAPREVGGAGLGLAIARAQARAQGGDLRLLDSERGACFELELPLAAGAGEPAAGAPA